MCLKPKNKTTKTDSVRDFLFGYYDAEIAAVHRQLPSAPASWPGVVGNISDYETALQLPFHGQYTGLAPNEEHLREYMEYNGHNYSVVLIDVPIPVINITLPIAWGSDRANRISGSDGLQFPRYLQPGQSLQAWVDDLKRPVTLINENKYVCRIIAVVLIFLYLAVIWY